MVGVELQMKPVERIPRKVAAKRLVGASVGGQRAAVGQVFPEPAVRIHTRVAEMLRIEDRTRDRAVGPFAGDVAEVELHADVAVASFDGVS